MGRRLCIALIVLTSPAIAQCSPGKAEQAAATAHQRQTELLRYQAFEMETQVPPKLSFQIASFKDALADAANATLSCTPPRESAAAIQNRLAKLLHANQPEKPAPEAGVTDKLVDGIYGTNLRVAVSTPVNEPQLRGVTLSFGIECSDDTMLLIYEATPTGWHQLLRWQSPEYNVVSGAFGDFFFYTVLAGTNPRDIRVAVAHGTPWCTSFISEFKVDLVAPQAGSILARIIWHTEEGYRRNTKPKIRALSDGFELRGDDSTIETDQLIRTGIFRYRVTGDKVERVQPIALDGRGFVDAWLQAPWSEAQQWSISEGLPAFERVHEIFTKAREDTKTFVTYTYGPVRACQTKGRYQVQMNADPGGPQFYTIEERPTGYIMVNYSTAPDERCSGPDLMKKP